MHITWPENLSLCNSSSVFQTSEAPSTQYFLNIQHSIWESVSQGSVFSFCLHTGVMIQQSPSSSTFLWPSKLSLKGTQRNHGNLHSPYSQTLCTCSIFGGQRKTIHRGSSVTTQPVYMQWLLKLYFLLYVTAPHHTHLSSLSLMTNPINSSVPIEFHDKTLQEIFFQGVHALLSFSC